MLCAVLCWSGAALRLKDRDEWIDWDPLTRGSRLPLVTQLRRFLVLESRREPNLATRCMGLGLRKLPAHFEEKYGYRPLLAESFSDPQLHEGTIYKASNWTPLGFSKGFKRHEIEFHVDEESPKKYWVYPLLKNPQQLLSSPSPLPEIYQKGTCEGVAGARCALAVKHLRSLSDAFYNIPDHRSPYSRRHAKIAMFGLIAHGLLVGAPTVKAIWKRCGALSQGQRKAIGLNVRNEGGRLVMPSYEAINDFINGVDPQALADALNQWLAVHQDKLHRSTKEGAEPAMAVRLFGTSHEYGSKTAAQISKMARDHWSVENLNHWKRDATYWREDRGPKRNPKGAKNLALLRNALLAVIPFEEFDSLNDAFDYYRDHRDKSLKLIKTAPPCQD